MNVLSRRDLLKAGGALIISFSFLDKSSAQTRQWQPGPPDAKQIDSWIAIHADNTATVYLGFAELGQGCSTALLQIAAEELDLSMAQVKTVGLDTHLTPNQGGTYSSQAIRRGGPQVQRAAAEARAALLALASERLQLPVEGLRVENGIVSGRGDDNAFTTYGELIGDKQFKLAFTGTAPLKNPATYKLVAKPVPRNDIPLKAKGTYRFIQHLRLPNMLHGRIVRPRGQGAYKDGAQIIKVDPASISKIPNARIVRQGNFLAVVAPREWDAVKAAQQLKVEWNQPASLPGSARLFERMQLSPPDDRIVRNEGDIGLIRNSAVTAEMTGYAPYQAHVPFAPNCALADVQSDNALVLCSSQDVYATRTALASLLGLKPEQVRVQYHDGAGTFGHSCWNDAAMAAALISKLAGAPVRVQFMRWDEHGWDTYGPAHLGKVQASATADGKLLTYAYEGWQHHWSLIETSEQLANSTPAAEWPANPAQQINPLVLGGQYQIPNIKLINHHVPGIDYLRGAWLRSPLDLAFAFISEQAIDALAFSLKLDPYQFRKQNIRDARWEGVLDAAASAAGWQLRAARAGIQDGKTEVLSGRGIGLGTHLASWGGAVAEIEVNKRTGVIRVLHLVGAIDAGRVVNPSNVENQIIGQLVQTASRMLHEEVTFDEKAVTSLDWNTYPILRFSGSPRITPVIVQHLNEESLGAGEEVMAAAAAAIANAFFDATGKRLNQFPMTPQRVLAALA